MSAPLQSILYSSCLAAQANVHGIAHISKVARQFTADNGISGVLVFDGAQFCEYLEGPAEGMQVLLGNIRNDERHTHMQVLHEEYNLMQRRLPQWFMAYTEHGDAGVVPQVARLRGEAALAQLQALLHTLRGDAALARFQASLRPLHSA